MGGRALSITNRQHANILASNAYIVFVKTKSVRAIMKSCRTFFQIPLPRFSSLEQAADIYRDLDKDQDRHGEGYNDSFNSSSSNNSSSSRNMIRSLLYERIEKRPDMESLEEEVDE